MKLLSKPKLNGPVMLDISVDKISPSPTNPRKTFDPDRLKELSESVREKGLISPILVRPNGKAGHYELVAGERRFRATKLAKLATIPCIVRELDDKATLELQVIENLQREDLSPVEEARGYELLMKKHGYTADLLAEKLNRSKGYLYSTLKLLKLRPDAVKAVEDGRLPRKCAELLARVPEQAGLKVLTTAALGGSWQGVMSFDQLKREIQDRYMRQLKGAVFPLHLLDLKDKQGVMPACNTCPNRAGNNPDCDVRPDMCMVPACYQRKVEAWRGRLIDQLPPDKGIRPEKVYDGYGYLSEQWVNLTDTVYADRPRNRSWKQLLNGSDVRIYETIDKSGGMVFLAPKVAAQKHAAKEYKIKFNSGGYRASYSPPVDKLGPQRKAAAQAVLAKLEKNCRETQILGKPWKMIALLLAHEGGNGLEFLMPSPKPKGRPRDWIQEQIESSDAHGQILWATKLAIARLLMHYVQGWGGNLAEYLAVADIDLAAEEKAASAHVRTGKGEVANAR